LPIESSLVGRGGPIAVEPGRPPFARGASLNAVARPSGGFSARGFAASGAAPETHAFQAETRRLLDIVTNSLYTDKEVFVRELVSNASDALEKCRHEFLVRGQDPGSLTIDITTDEEKGTFSIADTGLGMSKDDLIANLGVIARSGSRAFVEEIDGSEKDDSIQKQKQTDASSAKSIIGKFGVGFYSAFMVSDRVEVFSNKGDGDGGGAYKWSSAGDGEFSVAECSVGDGPDEAPRRGTRIVLHVKDSEKALASSAWSVEAALKKHSAFVGFPVTLNGKEPTRWTRCGRRPKKKSPTKTLRRFTGSSEEAVPRPKRLPSDCTSPRTRH
jgi:TNF receptor-associated protein 1